jgi:peptide/nickel transport system substrate-binding protein/oligopeptide transport system substrate-binding protein
MESKQSKPLVWLITLTVITTTVLAACSPQPAAPTPAPQATQAQPAAVATEPPKPTAKPTEPPKPQGVVNRAGVTLPADAAPLAKQVMRYAETEARWLTWDASVYDENVGDYFAWADSCIRPDKNYVPQPNICTKWETSKDGLTWTFYLDKKRQWSDGQPITADDFVFTLQHFARPDYDFEWFYSMANIVNWGDVVSGKKPPEELGAKKVDDYTFTVTTDQPTPYLDKIFADLWVVPKHVVKDRLNDGSWAFDKNNWVFAGAYKLESWDKGKQMVFVANDKYNGPFPPMMDKIIVTFMTPETRWPAYKNGELDAIGGGYQADLPPSAMAEIMASPELKKQLISWPNFMTYYLFFDAWNKPFDNLKVRQAFSHAVDRDKLINGPLQYQGVAAYTMNPPGFPGESVNALKGVQAYDPKLAAKLMEEAGFPGGKGFPKLTLYLRQANPAQVSAGEAIAGMLKDNLGVTVEIQNLDYGIYTEKLRNQKKNKSGDFVFALVPYEFDFVDGSNMLSPWGGCEKGGVTDMSAMPGRHTWYNKDFNKLLCDAGAVLGDEAKRNTMYQQAEKILIEDVALVPIYHPILVAMVKPDIKGPMFAPDKNGTITWHRNRFTSRESLIYHSTTSR